MKKLALLSIFVAITVAGFGFVGLRGEVSAGTGRDDVCAGLEATGGSCDPGGSGGLTIEGVVQAAVNIMSWAVGIIAVIMIIVGGAKYVTSAGDSSGIQSAKNTIMYALIGVVIVALAQVIVRFTVDRATNTAPARPACSTTITSGCVDPATGEER